jgi:hypothetical protein
MHSPGNNKKAAFLQLLWYAISCPFDFSATLRNNEEEGLKKIRIQKQHSKKFIGFMKMVLFMFEQRLMSKQCGEIFKSECRLKNLKIEGLSSGEGIKLCLFN